MCQAYIVEGMGTASRHRRRAPEIALGHRASRMKLMATLNHALEERGKCYGLRTIHQCGAIANVTILGAL